MSRRVIPLALLLLLTGCASTASIKNQESATILLNNGDSIKAQILDVWRDKVVFKAEDWNKAYEYGEVINVERIEGIELADGTVLSVKDYDAYRKGKTDVAGPEKPERSETPEPVRTRAEPQPTPKPGRPATSAEIAEVANSLVEADLAAAYLSYLNSKRSLTPTESRVLEHLHRNPQWQDEIDDIKFLDRKAFKELERAYLFAPDDLKSELGLDFDPDREMNYLSLMDQLHRRMGTDVQMPDYRKLVQVLGESGGKAVKRLLENYELWKQVTREQ